MDFEQSIQVFVTGGTFDKTYDHIKGTLNFQKTHLPQMLVRSKCRLDLDVKTLMLLDSLEMTATHFETIIKACETCKKNKIVITHGTDCMVDTAKKIAEEAIGIQNKTIILTGAMIPYTFGSSSDGFFNLGSAMAYVRVLYPGVYIAMNGMLFNWDEVKKNKTKGVFEQIKPTNPEHKN